MENTYAAKIETTCTEWGSSETGRRGGKKIKVKVVNGALTRCCDDCQVGLWSPTHHDHSCLSSASDEDTTAGNQDRK